MSVAPRSLLQPPADPLPDPNRRPLPDERPRQSVANLIGRFEQQGKRQASPALPAGTRSPSVSSQVAGDVAKVEAKERREWPPKPAAPADLKPVALPPFSASVGTPKSPVASPPPVSDSPPPSVMPIIPTLASPEPVKPPPSKGKPVAAGKSTPASGTRRSIPTPAKSRSPNTNTSSTRPSIDTPPRTSLQTSLSQPLRSQHTGQSVASNPSTIRARSVPRTAPSTPSRPKSSAAQNRPVTRPKTPSSGLFAPTAASLARSRNAPPPPPPPVKKATLSSDAAERLSKPTAASLSKARTPATPAPSPARVVKSTSTGTHAPTLRGSSKLKAGRTPLKPKMFDTKEEIRPAPASVFSEPSPDSSHVVADPVENGHDLVPASCPDAASPENIHGHSEDITDVVQDPEVTHPGPEVYPERQGGGHSVEKEEEVHSIHGYNARYLQEETLREDKQTHLDVSEDEAHAGEAMGNGDSTEYPAPGNDIEDIVNLLEGTSVSKLRPQSIVSIPDENPDDY